MTASTTAMASSTSVYNAPAFWERLWRTSGLQFVVLFIIAYIIYGYQPQVGAPATHWSCSTTAIAPGF
jgi:hypothetical protein